jgi:FkbM family methyltransferase
MDTTSINEEKIIHETLLKKFPTPQNLFFIQIGSNDGKTLDPLHDYIKKYSWKGILVEPVSYLFDRLLKTYEGIDGLFFENVAIDKQNGVRKFYHQKENYDPEVPFWYSLLGSFNKDVIYKHKPEIPGFDKYLVEEDIKCVSLSSIIEKYHIDKVDIMHIDTEGYDFEIIKLIPFARFKPAIIFFEFVHLTETDRIACRAHLAENGYTFLDLSTDTFAFLEIA